MNFALLSKVKRRVAWLKRRREFRRAIQKAALGDVDFAIFPKQVSIPVLEVTRGEFISNPTLRVILQNDELGAWAFDAATLALLEHLFLTLKPKVVLEFGAGISTLALAQWMKSMYADNQPRVFSIEQNDWQIEKTRQRLYENQLDKIVELLHAPLQKQQFFGIEEQCYKLSEIQLEVLKEAKPELIIVDGPAGDDLIRFGTLAQLHDVVAQDAIWFLDDAMRDEEREVLSQWEKLSFLTVEGTYAVGKGLARGHFTSTSS